MSASASLRIATYNIHKCRGMDRSVSPERIAAVIREVKVDVVALQEVLREEKRDQFRILTELTGLQFSCFGENRKHRGAAYGNAVLSRFPIQQWQNYDITATRREARGLLRADIRFDSALLHVLNIHMGTGLVERRRQARLLLQDVLLTQDFSGRRILLGDFNEWTQGLATKILRSHFRSAEWTERAPGRAQRKRSYPGVLPLLHLDHVYYDEALRLKTFRLHRSPTALIASDHLPLVACFEVNHSP